MTSLLLFVYSQKSNADTIIDFIYLISDIKTTLILLKLYMYFDYFNFI